MLRLATVFLCLCSSTALALPHALNLEVQTQLQLGLGQSAPPVILPEPGPSPSIASDGYDHLRLRDGRELRGKILTQVQDGFLFHDPASNASFVVPFTEIADLQRAQAPQLQLAPQLPAPAGGSVLERRFFLQAELRDLQTRYDALSLWPAIESIIGGAAGIAVGVVILAFFGTDTLDLVFAALAGVTGLISLGVGTFEMIAVENHRSALGEQMAGIQDQLSQLPQAALAPAQAPLAFRF